MIYFYASILSWYYLLFYLKIFLITPYWSMFLMHNILYVLYILKTAPEVPKKKETILNSYNLLNIHGR